MGIKMKEQTCTMQTLATYNKYKKFVNNDRLPDFETQYCSNTGYICSITPWEHPIKLKINKLFIDDKSLGASLYHEFTHIYDYYHYIGQADNLKVVLRPYSEYHASQIEILKKYNLATNILDEISVDAKDKRILDLLDEPAQYIESYYKNITAGVKHDIETKYIYYMGVTDIVKRITGMELQTNDYLGCEKEKYIKIHKLLETTDYKQHPDIDLIKTIYELYAEK